MTVFCVRHCLGTQLHNLAVKCLSCGPAETQRLAVPCTVTQSKRDKAQLGPGSAWLGNQNLLLLLGFAASLGSLLKSVCHIP